MYSNFHVKLLIKSACFPWSQLRAEIHILFCSSSPLSLLFSPLPRCLLELSLESDLYYLSLTLSPWLCFFLRLNGDLDKRVWAAREQPLNTKRQTKRKREEVQRGAESQGQMYWAICTLFHSHPVAGDVPDIYQTGALGSKCCLTVICSSSCLLWVSFIFLL